MVEAHRNRARHMGILASNSIPDSLRSIILDSLRNIKIIIRIIIMVLQ
jgi:hypothetical protein